MNKILSKKITSVLSILVVLVLLDQWTKQLAVKHLKNAMPIHYIDGMFQLVYAENPGAFLGMGGNMSSTTRFVIFGLFVAVGLAVMLWSVMTNKISQSETVAYSFILAGGIGNVIDRLTHSNGHVIDFMFIDLKFAPLARTGVFNIADVAIVIGVVMLLFQTKKTIE
jgi:signal peptidase II